MFYVYAHFDNNGTCFYIGKGKQNRAWSKYGRNQYWKRIVAFGYHVIVLQDNLIEQDAFELEKGCISRYSPRANFTLGGSGGCTVTEQTKPIMSAKVSIKRKLWWATKTLEDKQKILKNAHYNNVLKNWAKEDLSKEQARRSSFRVKKPVFCLSNNKTYTSAKVACEDLHIPYTSKIFAACNGSRPHYRGYKFKYIS